MRYRTSMMLAFVCIGVVESAANGRAEDSRPPRTQTSPHLIQQPVEVGDAKWTSGFWADRFALCHKTILPEMRTVMEDQANGAVLDNFRVAAGVKQGQHRGTDWSDGDCYKWLEAMAWIYSVTRDSDIQREMDHWIDLIARSQADDGYIGTQTQLNPNKPRWGQRHYHELYNQGHLLTAAAVHKRATGSDKFVRVARQLADYLDIIFRPQPEELAAFGWNPSNIMGLVDLYRVTGDKRYLDLAGVFIEMRGSVEWPHSMWGLTARIIDPHPGDQNQNRVPLRKERVAVGHAVTGPYLWCGAADVIAETGDTKLRDALNHIWSDVARRKMYVTGAIGAYHHGVSVRFDLVHEAFGREYELPQRNAYNETCANISNAMWNRRMMLLSGDAKYADVVERVLYNSALSPMSLDGRSFCYCNPLRRQTGVPLLNHDTPQRIRTLKCFCCPPSVARTLAKSNWWAYGVSNDAVWVNLYGSSELNTTLPDGQAIRIVQQTGYPWKGEVQLRIVQVGSGSISLKLRIPGWAESASITINGEPIEAESKPGTYVEIRRVWESGDAVTLDLPMTPILIQADPRVEQTWGQASVMCGPVVYCAESVDLPEGVSLWDVRLPRKTKWSVQSAPDLLGGVTVLETDALAVPPRSEPLDDLFQRVPTEGSRSIRLKLIPYYAWNNRGETEMTVWLPLN